MAECHAIHLVPSPGWAGHYHATFHRFTTKEAMDKYCEPGQRNGDCHPIDAPWTYKMATFNGED